MREVRSFCKICSGLCGMVLKIDERGQLEGIRSDHDHPMSRGYNCIKGLQAPEVLRGPGRLLHPLKRMPDGAYYRISYEQAVEEISEKLNGLIEESGADGIALFRGTASYSQPLACDMHHAWLDAIGSTSLFTTSTIDQSAKKITAGRLGTWDAGKHWPNESDVMLLIGNNPLVSVYSSAFDVSNITKTMKALKARGMKLIVIDPRRTETAHYADVFIQALPGEDVVVLAAIIRIILAEGWIDHAFCQEHVNGIEELRAAVEPFTAEAAAARAGVEATDLHTAAVLFARDSKSGSAVTSTGACMAPHSNLADHLSEVLNVLCGRLRRVGDLVPNPGVLSKPRSFRAQVIPPIRPWEATPQSRIRGAQFVGGERTTCTLPDEILTPGPERIRALIVDGGNVAKTIPGEAHVIKALSSLDLLVAIDPVMSMTAQLAHYVLPPLLAYEYPMISGINLLYEKQVLHKPFQQYSPAVIEAPKRADLMAAWQVLWSLASRMGRQVVLDGVPLDMDEMPTTDAMLELVTRHGRVSLSEVRQYPQGHVFEFEQRVEPAEPGASGRFELMAPDVRKELEAVAATSISTGEFPYRLSTRRLREIFNTQGQELTRIHQRRQFNPAFMNPADISELGLSAGARIEVRSRHGTIEAIIEADDTVRRGVVSMPHGFGVLPTKHANFRERGSSVNRLIDPTVDFEPINAMAWMSAIPVAIRSVTDAAPVS